MCLCVSASVSSQATVSTNARPEVQIHHGRAIWGHRVGLWSDGVGLWSAWAELLSGKAGLWNDWPGLSECHAEHTQVSSIADAPSPSPLLSSPLECLLLELGNRMETPPNLRGRPQREWLHSSKKPTLPSCRQSEWDWQCDSCTFV